MGMVTFLVESNAENSLESLSFPKRCSALVAPSGEATAMQVLTRGAQGNMVAVVSEEEGAATNHGTIIVRRRGVGAEMTWGIATHGPRTFTEAQMRHHRYGVEGFQSHEFLFQNIMKLSQGKYVALEEVENVYVACPVVQQIIIHGDSMRSHLPYCRPVQLAKMASRIWKKRVSETDLATLDEAAEGEKVVKTILGVLTEGGIKYGLKGYELVKRVHHEFRGGWIPGGNWVQIAGSRSGGFYSVSSWNAADTEARPQLDPISRWNPPPMITRIPAGER